MTGEASRTALATTLMRALHTRFDRPALLDDPWGERLVTDAEQETLLRRYEESLAPAARAALDQLDSRAAKLHAIMRRSPFYAGVIVRSRYAEEMLAAAVERGVRQYVILGAGFDSFGVRQPAFARDLDVFEVDHPSTQALKRRRLEEAGAVIPGSLHFVAADLGAEALPTALGRSAFRPDQSTFVSWLGVTAYLTREANFATLRAIARCTPPGSELVFTYLDAREFDPARRTTSLDRERARVAAIGEPMVSGFDPERLPAELREIGLELIEDLGAGALRQRYFGDGGSPARVTSGHVARARTAPK